MAAVTGQSWRVRGRARERLSVMTAVEVAPRDARMGLSAASTAVVCWAAGNIMVTKVPLGGLQIAFWRILLAAVVYTGFVYVSGRRITREHLRRSTLTGVTIGLEIAIFFVAIKSTTVGQTWWRKGLCRGGPRQQCSTTRRRIFCWWSTETISHSWLVRLS